MSRASTRFTEALLLLLMFFLFVSFCSTGWGVKAKQSGLIKQNHQTSQLTVAQGKISGRERNKISKGTILTKASATAKRPHIPGFPASLELSHRPQPPWPLFCLAAQRGRTAAAQLCPGEGRAVHTVAVCNSLDSGYPQVLRTKRQHRLWVTHCWGEMFFLSFS